MSTTKIFNLWLLLGFFLAIFITIIYATLYRNPLVLVISWVSCFLIAFVGACLAERAERVE